MTGFQRGPWSLKSSGRKMNLTYMTECIPEEVGCLRQLTVALMSVSSAVGVVANGLVIWMTLFRMARTVTTIWFFNLALVDFTVLLSLPIATYTMATGQWLLDEVACKLYMTFLALNFFTSICLLVIISLDRCISVLYPVWCRNHRTVQRAVWLAVGVWLLAAVMCSPYLKFRTIGKENECFYCYFKFDIEKKQEESSQDWDRVVFERRLTVVIVHFLVGFLVPLVVISACAHLICTKLRGEGWVHASRPKRLLLVLVSAFFIFWFPFNVALLVQLGQLQNEPKPKMLLILWATFSLGCLNSCLNPFLYVFIGRDFREKFFQSLPFALARAFGEEGFVSACPRGEALRE
ncbi:LOW QUALITY PROTEIN: probable G-protein coupled receptor 32 [Sus scrofa]|uniref:LOW QUALITY PROTEIN: probable G-protein coupled receptor 32 n=1 Tax=Sus scrofa TaxID=9823 RepID=UPI000A2B804B|nr:LOW QUALITY PROTEIN: probable G-protein coupled receptor 32 [Sus scrofa]